METSLSDREKNLQIIRGLLLGITTILAMGLALWVLFNPNLIDAIGSFWDTLVYGLPEKRLKPGDYDFSEG